MRYTIDRFEGKYAVCESETGEMISIPAENLPKKAKEGDIIIESNGIYAIDRVTGNKAKAEIEKLMDDIFGQNDYLNIDIYSNDGEHRQLKVKNSESTNVSKWYLREIYNQYSSIIQMEDKIYDAIMISENEPPNPMYYFIFDLVISQSKYIMDLLNGSTHLEQFFNQDTCKLNIKWVD
jgi:hypothetical protein